MLRPATWFVVRMVAALTLVQAVDVWILRLDPAWQFVSVIGVTAAAVLVDVRPPASAARHSP